MMLSQTAADVHAFFEAFLQSNRLLDMELSGIMGGVMKRIVKRGNYHHVSIFLDCLDCRGLDSDDRYSLRDSVRRGERAIEAIYKNETCDGALPSQHSQHAFTVAVAAVLHLLAFVFQYLIGYIDRGGTKTYSSGCFDFRASFVSILLFLAAFVWIKFRQAARPSTGKRKARSTQLDHPGDDSYDPSRVCVRGEKFEARYTIPKGIDKALPDKHRRISLGLQETREKAACLSRVAQSYYEEQRGACCVKLWGYQFEFPVPPMSEEERGLVGEEKKDWVKKQAKDVGTKMYEELYAKQQLQLAVATGAGSSNPFFSYPFQPPLIRGPETADEPLHVLGRPSCPGLPCEETEREVLNPGSPPFQEQHPGPAQEHSFGEVPPIDGALREITDEDLDEMFNSESAPIPGNDAFPYFGAGADAVEHGRPEPLPQGIIGAGDAVLHSAGFGPTVIERSEPLVLSQQYQQPQAYGGQEFLHQVSEQERAKQLALATVTGSNDRSPSRRTRQPSHMLAYTAHQPLNEFEAPSCSVPHQPRSVETVGEELNPGWQSIQEQHEGRTHNLEGRVISEEVVSTPCEYMLPRSPAMAACDHHPRPPEGGTLDGDKTYSEFAPIPEMPHSGAEAVEQGSDPQFEPLLNFQQGMCDGNPVQQNVAFESAVGEQSESEQQTLVQQQQQPQAYDEEFVQDLEYQQGSESQNPGLQQVHTPSQQISDHLVEEDPYKIISNLMETCSKQSKDNQCLLDHSDRLSKDNQCYLDLSDRLRKEKQLAEQEKERWRDKYEGLRNEIVALARKFM